MSARSHSRRSSVWMVFAPLVLAACSPGVQTKVVGRGAVADPEAPGPYLVVERDVVEDGGRLYIPSSSSIEIDPALLPLPFVVFIPAFSAQEADYRVTLRHLASHGFVVLGAKHGFDFVSATFCKTQREGFDAVRAGIAEVTLAARTPGHELEGLVEPQSRFATVGHSFGGKLALWLAVESMDVAAVVALDPVDGGDERRPGYCDDAPEGFPRVATLLGTAATPPVLLLDAGLAGECAPADGNGEVLFGVLQRDAVRLHLPRADHTDFVDDAEDGACGVCGLCPEGEEEAAAVLRLVRAGTVAFLRQRVLQDRSMDGWDLLQGPVEAGGVTVEREAR